MWLAIFLGPSLIYIFVWRILPLLSTAYLSFSSWNVARSAAPKLIGWGNFVKLSKDALFAHSLWISLLFTIGSTFAELLIGLGMAILIDRKFRSKNIVQVILLLPMFITPAVTGTLWYILYHDSIGPINWFLTVLSFNGVGWLSTPGMALISTIIADVWQWTPFMFLLLFSALQTVPVEMYEAAQIDGASDWGLFRHIAFPSILGTIGVSILLRAMDAFREFDKIFVLTGGGPGNSTEVVSVLIYKAAFRFFDMGYAAAMVLVVFVILSFFGSFYLRFIKFASK